MMCLLAVIFLLVYQQLHPYPFPDYSVWERKQLRLTGTVTQKQRQTNEDGTQTYIVYLKHIQVSEADEGARDEFPIAEGARVYLDEEPRCGSVVEVEGKLRTFRQATNPGGFDARLYYRTLGLSFSLTGAELIRESAEYDKFTEALWQWKQDLVTLLASYLRGEDAALVSTMLLGEKANLDAETKNSFQRNGVIHILTVSGLHISILGMGLYRLLRKLLMPVIPAAAVAMGVMLCYGTMVGTGASCFRALFMFGMHLTADVCGRTYDLLTALALAAVLLLFGEPMYFYNSGYLFSFASVLAIGALLPLFPAKRKLIQSFVTCFVVYLGTIPIHLLYYYEYPYISFVLNLLVIPLMSVLLKLSLGLLAAAKLAPPVARLLAVPIGLILNFYRWLMSVGDRVAWSNEIMGEVRPVQVVIYIALLAVLIIWWNARPELTTLSRNLFVCCALLFLTARFFSSGLSVTMLDVGQGDCILIERNRKVCVIDGGSSSQEGIGEYTLSPYLKSRGIGEIDTVFVTHTDKDHYSGIEELILTGETEHIKIERLILPALLNPDEDYLRLCEEAKGAGIRVYVIGAGESVSFEDVTLKCLHPCKDAAYPDKNEASLVLLADWKGFTALFTGDLDGQAEAAFAESCARLCDVSLLKVGHHGSAASSKEELLETVKPEIALISCAADNSYGHPAAETLDRLEKIGSKVYITKDCGAITVRVSNGRMWVETFR